MYQKKDRPKETGNRCIDCNAPILDFAALLGDGIHCTKCQGNKIYIIKSKPKENDSKDFKM